MKQPLNLKRTSKSHRKFVKSQANIRAPHESRTSNHIDHAWGYRYRPITTPVLLSLHQECIHLRAQVAQLT